MGGPRQKGITSYSELTAAAFSLCACVACLTFSFLLLLLPLLAISSTQTAALRGAFAQYAFFGYKRVMQQAPYFVLPLGAGECSD